MYPSQIYAYARPPRGQRIVLRHTALSAGVDRSFHHRRGLVRGPLPLSLAESVPQIGIRSFS